MLRSVDWELTTNVSGQPTDNIFKCQAAWLLKMGPISCCPETSVTNYQSTLSNIREERRSHFYGSGSLKSFAFLRIKGRTILTHGGLNVKRQAFWTSTLTGQWVASRPGRFMMGKNSRHPLYKQLNGSQSRYGLFWEENVPQSGSKYDFTVFQPLS